MIFFDWYQNSIISDKLISLQKKPSAYPLKTKIVEKNGDQSDQYSSYQIIRFQIRQNHLQNLDNT